MGLVTREPYHGVSSRRAGERVALEVLRHHRLLELYLAEALGMPWDRVHEEAEVLEHAISPELSELIAAKLGNPTHDPHGDPIPTSEGEIDERAHARARRARARGARHLRARLGLRPRDAPLPRRARDRAGRRLRGASSSEPFDGPLTVRFGGAEHVLGGRLTPRHARGKRLMERATAPAEPLDVGQPALAAADRARPSPLERLRERGRMRHGLALLGPAFVAAVAYVDPGNFATNIAGGAKYGYLLLWVILAANLMAMLIQYLSAKVGIVTGTQPSRALPRALPAARVLRALDPGRADRDGHRPRGVRRRRDRAQPALRRAAVRRRPDHRRRRLRDPRAPDARPPPLRDHDHRACSG